MFTRGVDDRLGDPVVRARDGDLAVEEVLHLERLVGQHGEDHLLPRAVRVLAAPLLQAFQPNPGKKIYYFKLLFLSCFLSF